MILQTTLISFLFAAVLTVACKSTTENPTPDVRPEGNASVQLAKAKADTKAAAQAMADYSYAKKAELVATMNRDLAVLQQDVDNLSARIESSSDAAKASARTKLEAVRDKLAQTKTLLAQAESATESTWNGAAGGLRQAYLGLNQSVEETRRWLSEKIAP
jgi:predicted  nucleic acid-binding Zn-ribbon protein